MTIVTYLYILLAGVAHFLLGFLWYSPKVLGTRWMTLMGITNPEEWASGGMKKTMSVGFIGSLVTYSAIGYLILKTGALTWVNGASLGFVIWLGFIAATFTATFLYEKKPFTLYLINTLYYLVSFVVLTAILVELI